jgi:hypothetical protein
LGTHQSGTLYPIIDHTRGAHPMIARHGHELLEK